MAIDIKNINEITFTQSFRGYNTEEVDDFLDDLYEEASANNKEIEELKRKIASLESGAAPDSGGMSEEEAYSIIANAQEEADKIIDSARMKAHALMESAERAQAESVPAAAVPAGGISSGSVARLKAVLNEMYEKQMAVLEGLNTETETKQIIREEKAPDVPSVSFSGITKRVSSKIPAERDILSEINSIGIGAGEKTPAPKPETGGGFEIFGSQESAVMNDIEAEDSQGDTNEFTFSFAEPEEIHQPEEPAPPVKSQPESFSHNEPEDPDDIIAQILRDNNRN